MRSTNIRIRRGTLRDGDLVSEEGTVWVGEKEDVVAELSRDEKTAHIFFGDERLLSAIAYMTTGQLAHLVSSALKVLPKDLLDKVMDEYADDLMDAESRAVEAAIPADVL